VIASAGARLAAGLCRYLHSNLACAESAGKLVDLVNRP
jgi:hypothetical protein